MSDKSNRAGDAPIGDRVPGQGHHHDAPQLEVDAPRGRESILLTPAHHAQRLTDILRHEGLPLNTRCGQRGLCDGCLIDLVRGTLAHVETGQRVTVADVGQPRRVHGCAHRPHNGTGAAIRVPARSLTTYRPQILTDFRVNVPHAHDPIWRAADGRPPAPPTGAPLGAAIDVGTTTVAVMLIDLDTGEPRAHASSFNRQMHLGDDVLTRINLCLTDPDMLGRLQHAILNETIAPLLDEALQHVGAAREQLVCLVVSGNTTMLHLVAGVDPSPMGVAPFTPGFLEHRALRLSDLPFHWPAPAPTGSAASAAVSPAHASTATAPATASAPATAPSATSAPDPMRAPAVHLLPSAAAYVGADLTAGVVASGLLYDPGPSLLVDVGTNGEIIFKHGEDLLGCATAAGPAFEGAGLTDGIRAGEGAISHVTLHTDPFKLEVEVIGDVRPIGICGSAYVDFLAEGVRTGLLDAAGRLHPERVPGAERYVEPLEHGGRGFRLGRARGSQPIVVTEADVARLLQAKAAIAAGILTLLAQRGMTPAEVKTLYLAGGFGMHMRLTSAIGCGLLPGFRPEQIQLVGNTALAGAYMALLDRSLLREMTDVGRKMHIIELNLDPSFEDTYIDQLTLSP